MHDNAGIPFLIFSLTLKTLTSIECRRKNKKEMVLNGEMVVIEDLKPTLKSKIYHNSIIDMPFRDLEAPF